MDYRELQDSKNLDNQQLADKIGIPRTTVSKYKNGHLNTKNMTLEMAVKWLRALGRRKMANDLSEMFALAEAPSESKENTSES